MVSVIIPVYNTECYLEECIKSVVSQTYQELEIIIINDGSTDSSRTICKKWEKADQRIRYIETENKGQGVARNLGITLMTGEYVIFVDSDDYLDETLISSVYEYITDQKADICVYGYNYVNDEGEICEIPLLFKTKKGVALKENKEMLGSMTAFLWNKMFSACLVRTIDFGMSNRVGEDLVFNAQLYRRAKKVCMIDQPFYFYRYNRNGNISTDYERYFEMSSSICELNQIFVDVGEFEEYWVQLYEISIVVLKDFLLRLSKRTDMEIPAEIKSRYPEFWKAYKECLEKFFSGYMDIGLQDKNYLLVGSYNLRVLLHCFLLDEDFLREDYGYSSIESMMSENINEKMFLKDSIFQNLYRKRCVEQDIGKYFRCYANLQDMDYVIMDLLDEISDVIKLGEDCYITESIFLKEIDLSVLHKYDRISFLTEERRSLFKKYLHRFMKKVKQSNAQVVVIKHFLCEKYSMYYDVFLDYDDLEKIRGINRELEWYYQYFTTYFPEVIMVEAVGFQELVFTHDGFPFGCEPIYYNSVYYQRMAVELNRSIQSKVQMKRCASTDGYS